MCRLYLKVMSVVWAMSSAVCTCITVCDLLLLTSVIVVVGISYSVLHERVCLLVALPYGLQFISKPVSRHSNKYTLQWTVSSYSPLIDFTLYLRQVPVNSTYFTAVSVFISFVSFILFLMHTLFHFVNMSQKLLVFFLSNRNRHCQSLKCHGNDEIWGSKVAETVMIWDEF